MARTIYTGDMRARQTELDTKMAKTYNSGDSLVVTHLTTNPPVSCLSTAERTGSAEFRILWSYVKDKLKTTNIYSLENLGRGSQDFRTEQVEQLTSSDSESTCWDR
jgi:hypothetical protein